MGFGTSLIIFKGIDVSFFCAGMFVSPTHLFLLLQEVETVNAPRTNRALGANRKDVGIGA